MRDFLAYAQFDLFWERFLPDTPFGRAAKEGLRPIRDPETLGRIWEETEWAVDLLQSLDQDAVRLSRIQHHLKRIPRVCEEPKAVYDEVDIFQFKKFLHNFKSLAALLGSNFGTRFGLSFGSEVLEQLLDTGRQSAESFYVADAYSAELAEVRREIRETDTALQDLQAARSAQILERWDFAFAGKAFLLVPRERIGHLEEASALLVVEPFDETRYSVRPRAAAAELLLLERRAALMARERSCEEAVLETLSHALRNELPRLAEYRQALTAFDLALARARLVREYRLVRPTLGGPGIGIVEGRFIPCEERCRAMGTTYVPLVAGFDASATVVFGSNMGGKTVVLKTLAFLQLCAQMGLFVPAEAFNTRLFHHFRYLGEGHAPSVAQGLSGFGSEIHRFVEASRDFGEPTLVLFDEFARTTHSLEAEAILSAVVEFVAAQPGVVGLFSTHYRGIRRLPGVRYVRMRGLNREGLDLRLAPGVDLEGRIRHIDQRMDYRLAPDDGGPGASDAIAVAALLGLEQPIVQRATEFFRNGN